MTRFLPFGSKSKTIQVNTLGGGAPAVTYATWNPADKGNLTLSGGDLIASSNVWSWETVRSTISKTSWKWYWETTITSSPDGFQFVWACDWTVAITNAFTWQNTQGIWYFALEWKSYKDGGNSVYWATFTSWDIIWVALNLDAYEITFYKNGTSQGVISLGWTGAIYASHSEVFTQTATTNFWATTFAYSVPSGYNAGLYT